jgi:hypothetical protein
MNGQEHKIDFGEGGEAVLIVDNPVIKFWKNPMPIMIYQSVKRNIGRLHLVDSQG